MESSNRSSLCHVSLSTAQTTPRKPSLCAPFPFPIRAPLSLDDDVGEDEQSGTESNDSEFGDSAGFVSLSVSEYESNEDDPDEETNVFVDGDETCEVGSGLDKIFVRPIAQLSWDDDGDFDCGHHDFGGFNQVGSEEDCSETTGIVVPSVTIVEKISVAPRVELFGFDSFEGSENVGGLGILEDCEAPDLKVDLGVESVTIEEYHVGVLKGFDCEEPLASSDAVGGYVEDELGMVKAKEANFLVSDVDGIECAVEGSFLRQNCNSSSVEEGVDFGRPVDSSMAATIGTSSDDFDENRFSVCKGTEDNVSSMAATIGTSSDDFDENRFSVCKGTEDNVSSMAATIGTSSDDFDENRFSVCKETEDNVSLGDGYEKPVLPSSGIEVDKEEQEQEQGRCCPVSGGATKDDFVADTLEFNDFQESRNESDSSGFSVSKQVNRSGCDEDSICGSETEQSVAASSCLRREDYEFDSQQFDGLGEEEHNKIRKIKLLRVKFLRLVQRLGISLKDPKVAQVLDNLALGFGKQTGPFGTTESTKKIVSDHEAENASDLNFSLNILVLGKSGVGKSATINLMFGEKKAVVNAFEPATTVSEELFGTIDGVKFRILDTPGLKVHAMDQSCNRKVLAKISKKLRKFCPDILLYVDRLDTETRETDLPMLKSITASLGSSIWEKAIITLTHSSSVSHKTVAARKSQAVRESIGKANLRGRDFACPVSLVENHPLISQDSNGRANLLLSCYSMKVLSEANFASMPEKVSNWKEVLGFATRA